MEPGRWCHFDTQIHPEGATSKEATVKLSLLVRPVTLQAKMLRLSC
jgi:hypothetical protein